MSDPEDYNNTPTSGKRYRDSNSESEITSPTNTVLEKRPRINLDRFRRKSSPETSKMAEKQDLKSIMTEVVKASEDRTALFIKGEIKSLKDLVQTVKSIKTQVSVIQNRVKKLEIEDKRRNIIVLGIKEETQENWKTRAQIISDLANKLGITSIDYDEAKRIGFRKNPAKDRPMLIRLVRMHDKQEIMSQRSKLKGTKIFINDDLSAEDRKIQSIMRLKVAEIRKTRPTAQFRFHFKTFTCTEGSITEHYEVNDNEEAVIFNPTTRTKIP